jgi:hypothetical protein
VNLPGDNIDTINKNTESLIDASKEVGLEVNIEKTGDQNAGQNREIKIGNKSFEKCVTVQVFGNDSNKFVICILHRQTCLLIKKEPIILG